MSFKKLRQYVLRKFKYDELFKVFQEHCGIIVVEFHFLRKSHPTTALLSSQGGNFRLSNNGSKATIENKGTHILNSSLLLLSLKGPERAFFCGWYCQIFAVVCVQAKQGLFLKRSPSFFANLELPRERPAASTTHRVFLFGSQPYSRHTFLTKCQHLTIFFLGSRDPLINKIY